MRPPEQVKQDLAKQWLSKADADVAVAELLFSHGEAYHEPLAFHCQQAAEKYLKALLTWLQLEFPKTHDIGQLLDLLSPRAPDVADALQALTSLTPFGVAARYPGPIALISGARAAEALDLARTARKVVIAHMAGLA